MFRLTRWFELTWVIWRINKKNIILSISVEALQNFGSVDPKVIPATIDN